MDIPIVSAPMADQTAGGAPAAAVLNTNIAAACAMLVWMFWGVMATGKPSTVGLINAIITGLVAITPAAGFVSGYGALIIGVLAGSAHGAAGAVGGLAVGLLADPKMIEYLGAATSTPPVAVPGWRYGIPPNSEARFWRWLSSSATM